MFALCDGNNFYASCERLFRPELYGKPVVVLSNNDGCVIARSEEAKQLGIKMADPEFMIRGLLKTHKVEVFSSNYTLYGDISQRMMHNLGRWFPKITIYSIDEAFGWLHGVGNLDDYCRRIRENVICNTGIPVSIGVAPTLTLAKMANKLAKKRDGTCVLDTAARITEAVDAFPLEDIWGIGRQYFAKLYRMGIRTAGDLRRLPEQWMKANMTVLGLRMWNELWGRPALQLHDVAAPKKGIMVSRSFRNYVTEIPVITEVLSTHATRLAEKLRENGLAAGSLQVFLLTNKNRDDEPQHFPSHTHLLQVATNNTFDLVTAATAIARVLFEYGYRYRKAGVFASSLVPEQNIQYPLMNYDGSAFDQARLDRLDRASRVIDQLNLAYGRGTVRTAAEGYKKEWRLKTEYLSRGYTTRWKDIIKTY